MADDLASVLALLHSSRRRWRTLRAEGGQWNDPERSRQAFERMRPRGGGMSFRSPPHPAEREPRWRVWVVQPDRGRSEFSTAPDRQVTVIANRGTIWSGAPGRPGRSHPDQEDFLSRLGLASRLLETATLSAAYDLEVAGDTTVAGRDGIVVRGRPRHPGAPRVVAEALVLGSDEIEVVVDRERGVLLAVEGRLDGEAFSRLFTDEIAFDEELADELFDIPADEAPPSAQEAWEAVAPPSPPSTEVDGPPDGVIGATLAMTTVLARGEAVVVALDSVVAYPTGVELGVTVRRKGEPEFGSFDATRPRMWSGVSAFPGESLRVTVVFADGRQAVSQNFGDMPDASGAHLIALTGTATQCRFDQRFWLTPLPPPGALGLVVAWPARDIPETRVDISADAIREAAGRTIEVWTP